MSLVQKSQKHLQMPELRVTLICEDIRREIGNKSSIMGLFGNGIYLPEIPTQLSRLSIWQRWVGVPDGGIIRIQIQGAGFIIPEIMAVVERAKDRLTLPGDPEISDISFTIGNLNIKNEGTFEIRSYIGKTNQKPVSTDTFYIRKLPLNIGR